MGGPTPWGFYYHADLYVGATADTLGYSGITSTSWSTSVPGVFDRVTASLPDAYPGGMEHKWYFQVVVRPVQDVPSIGHPPPPLFSSMSGFSQAFQAYASSSVISAYASFVTGGPSYSTWAPGTVPVYGSVPGAMGAITFVPEPSSLSLAALGAASLLFMRRKHRR